jgi:hypothetical protein
VPHVRKRAGVGPEVEPHIPRMYLSQLDGTKRKITMRSNSRPVPHRLQSNGIVPGLKDRVRFHKGELSLGYHILKVPDYNIYKFYPDGRALIDHCVVLLVITCLGSRMVVSISLYSSITI